jgi:HEAT repeat protein
MGTQEEVGTYLQSLMDMLASKDGVIWQNARRSLVTLGKPAVVSLTRTLQDSKVNHVRWEVVKTLDAIGDTRAIPQFVSALEDTDPDVAWLAGEALRKLKMVAWPPLLRALIERGTNSAVLRQGAHHVFKNQKKDGYDDLLATLTKALESTSAEESTPLVASDILKRMKSAS